MKVFSLVLTAFFLVTCTSSKPYMSDPSSMLLGRWNMDQIYDRGKDVSSEHNPANNRYIEFFLDGSFESGGEPYGRNTGKWSFDRVADVLFLDSDAGEGDDSYWIVTFDKEEMRWKGTRSDFTSRFELVHVKDKE